MAKNEGDRLERIVRIPSRHYNKNLMCLGKNKIIAPAANPGRRVEFDMKRFIILISPIFLIFLIFNNCSQQDDFPVLKGPYLGQKPPGLVPEIFAPGIVSTSGFNERDVTFSSDGKELYFTQWPKEGDWKIMCMRQENGEWTEPRSASFSGEYDEAEAFFTPDERKIFFISNRPKAKNGNPETWEIWYVERNGKGWGTPRILGSPFEGGFYTTFTKDWKMYYTANSDLYVSKYDNGKFSSPERLGNNVNTDKEEYNSFISPDESFLIFSSHGWEESLGEGDLYICFRREDGTWTRARNMGPGVNSSARDYCPSVSPDGKYFFFSSRRSGDEDIFWVDAKIIENLKPNDLNGESFKAAGTELFDFEPDIRLFLVFAFMNAAGYDFDYAKEFDPLRQEIRHHIKNGLEDDFKNRIAEYFSQKLKDYDHMGWGAFALYLSAPPELEVLNDKGSFRITDELRDALPLVREFYEKAKIEELWKKHYPTLRNDNYAFKPYADLALQQIIDYCRVDKSIYYLPSIIPFGRFYTHSR